MADVPSSLALQVDPKRDHIKGPRGASVTLVQYHDYACITCRQIYPLLRRIRQDLGEQYIYIVRHFPRTERGELAAQMAEAAEAQGKFWKMHRYLNELEDINALDDATLIRQAGEALALDLERFEREIADGIYLERVREDVLNGKESGVEGTPTFFVNDVRYDGPWDLESLEMAIERPMRMRIRQLFERFAAIEASGGLLLLLATAVALVWANSPWGDAYTDLWHTELAFRLGGYDLSKDLLHWINDGLMALFFLVVGLEIKREVLVGELSNLRRAILPVAGAVGGMIAPALIYVGLNAGGEGSHGWGVPMATDIAFMLGALALLGSRIPASLKVFFTALAIGDDIGAVLVIAVFYTSQIEWVALLAAAGFFAGLVALNRAHVYNPTPYALLGLGLWLAFLLSGVHATIAGVLLGMMIPASVPINMTAFLAQVTSLLNTIETPNRVQDENGAWASSRRQAVAEDLEVIAERIESPLQRMERILHPWTTYAVVPLFALANAGVVIGGDLLDTVTSPISLGIIGGLFVGKPLGISLISWLTVRLGLADLPPGVRWSQLIAATWLAGIGFTMSLFIAGTAFESDLLGEAKIGILAASVVSGLVGAGLLTMINGMTSSGQEAS